MPASGQLRRDLGRVGDARGAADRRAQHARATGAAGAAARPRHAVTSDPPTVTLFLYDIVEDPTVRNRPQVDARRQRRPAGAQAAARPVPALHGHARGAATATPSSGCSAASCRCSTTTRSSTGSSSPASLAGTPDELHVSLAAARARGPRAGVVGDRPDLPAVGQLRGPGRRTSTPRPRATAAPVRERRDRSRGAAHERPRPRWRASAAVAASPIWIRLRDTFTGGPPRGPLDGTLERADRRDAGSPSSTATSSAPPATSAFVNLGRSRDPATVGSVRRPHHRRPAPGRSPRRPTATPAITTTVQRLGAGRAARAGRARRPAPVPRPGLRVPGRTPLLAGRVVDAARRPRRPRPRVGDRDGPEHAAHRGGAHRRRRALPPARCAGRPAPPTCKAAHGGRTGSITVAVPADLSTTHQITLT